MNTGASEIIRKYPEDVEEALSGHERSVQTKQLKTEIETVSIHHKEIQEVSIWICLNCEHNNIWDYGDDVVCTECGRLYRFNKEGR